MVLVSMNNKKHGNSYEAGQRIHVVAMTRGIFRCMSQLILTPQTILHGKVFVVYPVSAFEPPHGKTNNLHRRKQRR